MTALTPQQMRELAAEWNDGTEPEPNRALRDSSREWRTATALRTAAKQLESVQAVVKRYAGWYEGGPEDSWRVERDLRTALGMEQYSGDDDA